jgi:hypothetical protein
MVGGPSGFGGKKEDGAERAEPDAGGGFVLDDSGGTDGIGGIGIVGLPGGAGFDGVMGRPVDGR